MKKLRNTERPASVLTAILAFGLLLILSFRNQWRGLAALQNYSDNEVARAHADLWAQYVHSIYMGLGVTLLLGSLVLWGLLRRRYWAWWMGSAYAAYRVCFWIGDYAIRFFKSEWEASQPIAWLFRSMTWSFIHQLFPVLIFGAALAHPLTRQYFQKGPKKRNH